MLYQEKAVVDILRKAGNEIDLSEDEAIVLLSQTNKRMINKIRQTADCLRQKQAGNNVTYVVNQNINFTNICKQKCHFCGFGKDVEDQNSYTLNLENIIQKITNALKKGATEVCIQGGLNPNLKIEKSSLKYYQKIIISIKQRFPKIHIHAFSPQEIVFISQEDKLSYIYVITELKKAGLDSIPGTAAEILNDQVRNQICPEKINSNTWIEIISLAHSLGIYTSSTMLCGHIENIQEQVEHLSHLRNLQRKSIEQKYPAKITEFILLPFISKNISSFPSKYLQSQELNFDKIFLLTAVSRIFLGKWIPNHQPSWVKLGLYRAVDTLKSGCNDFGGTLMEENISAMAGAKNCTYISAEKFQQVIKSINRYYKSRKTLYDYNSDQVY